MTMPSYDDSRDGGGSAGATTLSWTHTVGAGADRLLIVDSNQSDGTIAGHGTTGVQWDTLGTPVSFARVDRVGDTSGFAQTDQWYLVAPSSGLKQITITNDSSSIAVQGGSASYTGVDQTTPFNPLTPQTAKGAGGATTQPSLLVSSGPEEIVHDTVVVNNSPMTITPLPAQRQISNDSVGSGIHTGGSSDRPGLGGQLTPMGWTGATTTWAAAAVSIRGTPTPLLSSGPSVPVQQQRG